MSYYENPTLVLHEIFPLDTFNINRDDLLYCLLMVKGYNHCAVKQKSCYKGHPSSILNVLLHTIMQGHKLP